MIHFELIQKDITQLDVDAIVNAANSSLLGGSGVDGAIHRAAGQELLQECRLLGGCKTGEAKITKGYNLKAKHVIHTVGPVYSGYADKSIPESLLKSCYIHSMELARIHNLHSIAFPAISTGIYGYPKKDAAEASFTALKEWEQNHSDYDITVILTCFVQETYQAYQALLS